MVFINKLYIAPQTYDPTKATKTDQQTYSAGDIRDPIPNGKKFDVSNSEAAKALYDFQRFALSGAPLTKQQITEIATTGYLRSNGKLVPMPPEVVAAAKKMYDEGKFTLFNKLAKSDGKSSKLSKDDLKVGVKEPEKKDEDKDSSRTINRFQRYALGGRSITMDEMRSIANGSMTTINGVPIPGDVAKAAKAFVNSDLFKKVDTNKNGKIEVTEFLGAPKYTPTNGRRLRGESAAQTTTRDADAASYINNFAKNYLNGQNVTLDQLNQLATGVITIDGESVDVPDKVVEAAKRMLANDAELFKHLESLRNPCVTIETNPHNAPFIGGQVVTPPTPPTTPTTPTTTPPTTPTTTPSPQDKLDAIDRAKRIYDAIHGAGTNEDKLNTVIAECSTNGKLDKAKFDLVREQFGLMNDGDDLIKLVKEDLTDDEITAMKNKYGLDVNNYANSTFAPPKTPPVTTTPYNSATFTTQDGTPPTTPTPTTTPPATPSPQDKLDAIDRAKRIYDAIHGAGTNEDKLNTVIAECSTNGKLDKAKFDLVREQFGLMNDGDDLIKLVKEDLTDDEKTAMKNKYGLDVNNYANSTFAPPATPPVTTTPYNAATFTTQDETPPTTPTTTTPATPSAQDKLDAIDRAKRIYDAIHGAGTNEDKLNTVIAECSTNGKLDKAKFDLVREQYGLMNDGDDLVKLIEEDLTDDEKTAMKNKYGLDVNNYANSTFAPSTTPPVTTTPYNAATFTTQDETPPTTPTTKPPAAPSAQDKLDAIDRAKRIYEAIDGAGTNEDKLNTVIAECSTNGKLDKAKFDLVREQYGLMHDGDDLIKLIKEDLTDDEITAMKNKYGLDVNNYGGSSFK